MSEFKNKTVLVTGGNSGIGLAIAEQFSKQGARVFTAQRTPDNQFESIQADFSEPNCAQSVIDHVVKATGNLHVLVNNAGVMMEHDVESCSLDQWQTTLNVNLTSPFMLIKHAMPHLHNGGSIVNVGSIEGLASNPKHPAYCASKAGLHGLTRAVAVDHGSQGVRCNAVAPGWINTELNEAFIDGMPDPKQFRESIADIHPVGKTGDPNDVAAMVVFLASERAAFITGQVFTVDGGRTAQLSLPT